MCGIINGTASAPQEDKNNNGSYISQFPLQNKFHLSPLPSLPFHSTLLPLSNLDLHLMGNSIGGKKRTAKVMKVDGTTFRIKPPSQASDVLKDNPGYTLLESEEVKTLGLRAQPLDKEAPLKPGKLYFLVELPRPPNPRVPRRSWSGTLPMSAKDRLETLMLSRRTSSDLSLVKSSVEATADGAMRVKMRLPKAQVAKLVEESRDSAEAAERIMALCVAKEKETTHSGGGSSQVAAKKKRTRFVALPDEIIA